MKKIYSLLLTFAAAGSLSASAQQLPNNGFEEAWVDCIPWNSANTTNVQGTKPQGWCPSNVITPGMSAGNKTIASKVEGNNSSNAIELKNNNPIGNQIIPAYFTLGTTWCTATIQLATPSNEDGGTWGGMEFTYRPDALKFDFKHTNGSRSSQPGAVVIYSWKGSSTQTNVPAANSYKMLGKPSDPAKVTMTNRDRNILKMDYIKGDVPTYSSDFELISSKIEKISEVSDTWLTKTIEIDYQSSAQPAMFNVIFSAADYFADRSNHKGDDALTVDNVILLYYSRLASLTVNGAPVEGFSPDTYTYSIEQAMPDDASAIVATCLGNSGSGIATIALDKANNTATVTVTNSNAGGTDVDGQTSHVYTINFTGKAVEEPTVVSTRVFTGVINVTMASEPMDPLVDADVKLLEMSDGTYSLLLEKFGADAENPEGLGDINFNNLTLDGTRIYGTKNDISLAGGEIKAGGSLEGTLDGNSLVADLDLDWLDAEGNSQAKIIVKFTGEEKVITVVSTRVFTGVINVTMASEPMDPLVDADVKLLEMSDGTYSLLLEKFGADAENPEGLGDINFNNLTLDGTRIYGTKNDISLAGGEIKAGGSLEGTLDGNSLVADLDLDWLDAEGNSQAKIIVKFTGTEGTSGITDVPVDNSNAPVEYFNIQGMRINADNLTPGIYIRRQGTDVRKVLVK